MTKLLPSLLVLAASTLSGAAFGQAYLGLGVGQARIDLDCSGTSRCDRADTAAKVFGGVMFTPNWGLEAAYYDHGTLRQSGTDPTLGAVTADWHANGFGLFGVAALPLEAWSVFAKLGVVNLKVELDATSSVAGRAAASERHTDTAWGLGVERRFTRDWFGRLEFERARVKFQGVSRDADVWTLGAVYRF